MSRVFFAVVIEGYIEFSAVEIELKAKCVVVMLSLHGGFRAWKYPQNAVLLQRGAPFEELHTMARARSWQDF